MHMLMTPHCWQLFASQQTALLLLPPLTDICYRIQEWCMILNPNKTKVLVVSRSRTVNPPPGDLVLSVVSICASSNFDIFGLKFDRSLTFEDHIVSCVSLRIGILRVMKRVFVDTSVLLRCYYASVLPILEYCSQVWGSAAECRLQLLECQVY